MARPLLLLLIVAGGCAWSPPADPLATMLDRESDYSRRRAAARLAQRERAHDPQYAHTLRTIIWDNRYPAWQRIDAIDALLVVDGPAAQRELAARIMQLPDRASLNHVIELAETRRWTTFTGPLVRSWARPDRHTPDLDRPERQALQTLHPDRAVESLLLDMFLNADDAFILAHQLAAWDVLNRMADAPAMLAGAAVPPDSLAAAFDRASRELHVMPATRHEAMWLLHLRDPTRAAWWEAARANVSRLSDEQRVSLQLRHLPLLATLAGDDAAWAMSRKALLATVERTIGDHQPVKAELYDVSRPVRQWGERLCWGDLLAIHLLLRVLNEPDVVDALFRQADADLAENETEFGGVIRLDERGRIIAQMHHPLRRRGDYVFVPPQPMIEELYTGLFHYHFHAQKQHNAEHAAPGNGDLANADRLNFNFIVLTVISPDELNVDYHQRGGIVVDVATLRRGR